MNVSQVLDSDLLGYRFEDLPTPWMTNGVQAGRENSIPLCNPLSKSATKALIKSSRRHKKSDVLLDSPLTFKVNRPRKKHPRGTEVLEISGIHIPNNTLQVHWKVFLFDPNVTDQSGAVCPEFGGTFNFLPHVGQATVNPKLVWRMAVGPKLLQIGKDYVKKVVFTIVQNGPFLQPITFDRARIVYDRSPDVTI
jgi:polyphenol oxidase